MASGMDKLGRPTVVVTGMGVVTSLGAGKTDNWAKLTAGESGIRAHHSLPDRRPEDPHRGHDRFPPAAALRGALTECLADLAAEEAITESGIGAKGRFPRPAVFGGAADRDRMAATA